MKKFFLLPLMVLLSLTVILTGCQIATTKTDETKPNASSETADDVEITLMIPEWGVPSDAMLAKFKDETGIAVTVLPTSWDDTKNKVAIASAGQTAPADVFEVDWAWVGEFQSAGWIEKIDVATDEIADMPSIKSFMVDDDVYAIPYSNDVRIAYMNTEMTDAAGIKNAPTNWADLESAFKAVKDSGAAEYPLLFPLHAEEKSSTSFWTFAFLKNGIVFNDDNTLNKESALDIFTLIDNYVKAGFINPDSVSTSGNDVFKGIINADGAFLFGPSSYIAKSNNKEISKVVGKVTPFSMPSQDGLADNAIAFTEAIGVSPFSENKDAAIKFVTWYLKPDTQAMLYEDTGNIPTRTSVLQTLVDEGKLEEGTLIETNKMVKTPFPQGVPKYYTEMSTELFNILSQIGQGAVSPQEATDQFADKIDKLIEDNK